MSSSSDILHEFSNKYVELKHWKEITDSTEEVKLSIVGRNDEGHLIASLLIDLIDNKQIRLSPKKRKQHGFTRITYSVKTYGFLLHVGAVARECGFTGPQLEPLTWKPIFSKSIMSKPIDNFGETLKSDHSENDAGHIMQGKNH